MRSAIVSSLNVPIDAGRCAARLLYWRLPREAVARLSVLAAAAGALGYPTRRAGLIARPGAIIAERLGQQPVETQAIGVAKIGRPTVIRSCPTSGAAR